MADQQPDPNENTNQPSFDFLVTPQMHPYQMYNLGPFGSKMAPRGPYTGGLAPGLPPSMPPGPIGLGTPPGAMPGMQGYHHTVGMPQIPSMAGLGMPMSMPSMPSMSLSASPGAVRHEGPLGSFTYNRPQQKPRPPPVPVAKPAVVPPAVKPKPEPRPAAPRQATPATDKKRQVPARPFIDYVDIGFEPETIGLDDAGSIVPCASLARKKFVRNRCTKAPTATSVGFVTNDVRLQPELVCGACFVHQRPLDNCLFAGDRLVECAGCGQLAHRRCYGVHSYQTRGVGGGQDARLLKFQCDPCASGEKATACCVFCGGNGGLLKKATGQSYFAHIWCALCLPNQVSWLDIGTMSFRVRIPVPPVSGNCYFCKRGPVGGVDSQNPPADWAGGLVSCDHLECGCLMHPLCLKQYSIQAEQEGHSWGGLMCIEVNMHRIVNVDEFLDPRNTPSPDIFRVEAYCPQHVLMKLYCFCDRSPEVTQRELMIQCDFCLEWVHQMCLQDLKFYFEGTTDPIDLASQVNFVCPPCLRWRSLFLVLDQEWSEHVRPSLDDSLDFSQPQPASLLATTSAISVVSRYRLLADGLHKTTPNVALASEARPVALPAKDPYLALVSALLAWEQAGTRTLKRLPLCDMLLLATVWSRRLVSWCVVTQSFGRRVG